MSLKWLGEDVKKKYMAAAVRGVDRTMSECVVAAKRSHPGWINQTGFAEGSISVVKFAEQEGNIVRGLWGSASCNYMIWLELKHGSALRAAADAIYPRLRDHIREARG